MSMKPALWV